MLCLSLRAELQSVVVNPCRFQVPHALVADLDKQQTHWDKHTQTSQGATLQLGNAQVKLQYSPLQLDIAVDGKPAATFNGRQLFNFEHRRQKKVCQGHVIRQREQCVVSLPLCSLFTIKGEQVCTCSAAVPDGLGTLTCTTRLPATERTVLPQQGE